MVVMFVVVLLFVGVLRLWDNECWMWLNVCVVLMCVVFGSVVYLCVCLDVCVCVDVLSDVWDIILWCVCFVWDGDDDETFDWRAGSDSGFYDVL